MMTCAPGTACVVIQAAEAQTYMLNGLGIGKGEESLIAVEVGESVWVTRPNAESFAATTPINLNVSLIATAGNTDRPPPARLAEFVATILSDIAAAATRLHAVAEIRVDWGSARESDLMRLLRWTIEALITERAGEATELFGLVIAGTIALDAFIHRDGVAVNVKDIDVDEGCEGFYVAHLRRTVLCQADAHRLVGDVLAAAGALNA